MLPTGKHSRTSMLLLMSAGGSCPALSFGLEKATPELPWEDSHRIAGRRAGVSPFTGVGQGETSIELGGELQRGCFSLSFFLSFSFFAFLSLEKPPFVELLTVPLSSFIHLFVQISSNICWAATLCQGCRGERPHPSGVYRLVGGRDASAERKIKQAVGQSAARKGYHLRG